MWLRRFGLVRVRENAESIAFYGGEASEANLLFQRLGNVIANYGDLIVTSRNLSFFTSFYRWLQHGPRACWLCCLNARLRSWTACCNVRRFLIQILPAAVVAPLFFKGQIEFGVINQSSSAFNHILSDVSLVVYQVCQLPALVKGFSTSGCAICLKTAPLLCSLRHWQASAPSSTGWGSSQRWWTPTCRHLAAAVGCAWRRP